MANVIWPSDLCPRAFSLQFIPDVRRFSAPYGGSDVVTDLEFDSWASYFEVDNRTGATAAKLEALVNYLQGGRHTCEFGHLARPIPRGNLPISSTVRIAASKGSSVVIADSVTGNTIKEGDFFEVGGLLLQCSDDAINIDSALTIPVINTIRKDIDVGTAITFHNPKIKWRLEKAASVGVSNLGSSSSSLTFVENI